MATAGLVTRDDIKRAAMKRPTLKQETDPERLHNIGLKGIRSMNPSARHPEMDPSGVDNPLVYILGEAPGEEEDEAGEPFVGKSGRTLREHLPKGWQKLVRINNCVRTRPPNNRQPFSYEIECFRPSIEDDICKTGPVAILGVGFIPLTWALGYSAPKITFCRGRRFPIRIRNHQCWFYPTFHPSYIGRIRDSRELIDGIPGSEYEKVFSRDIWQCFDDAERLRPPHIPEISDDKLFDDVICLDGSGKMDFKRLRQFVERILDRQLLYSVDLETNRRRPYEAGAKILTASVTAKGEGTLAFALLHPEARWPARLIKKVWGQFHRLIFSPSPRVAHNAPFEVEWLTYFCGNRTMMSGTWHCTMAQAYVLDNRGGKHKGEGTQNLNFLCQQNLGIQVKQLTDVDRKRLEYEPLAKVLPYNGLDTKFDLMLYDAQKARIEAERMTGAYKQQIGRIPAGVFAQLQGLPIRTKAVKRIQAKLDQRSKEIEARIYDQPLVKRYQKRFGPFSPTNNNNIVRLFRDMLGRREGARGSKYSVDEEALRAMSDVALGSLILRLRSVNKLKSTYIDPLDRSYRKTVVFPDGRLHCQLNPTKTDTARFSIEDPSLQNFPIREKPWIRKVIGHPTDLILSFDFGAIQARCIGMESKDTVLCGSFWTDYDIHMEWAEKIAKKSNTSYHEVGKGDMDHFRSMVKNKMVFPAFFLSSENSITRDLHVSDRVGHELFEEFWDKFNGVKRWHKKCLRFYEDNLYIESLSGRRRHAPMSKSMIVNSPIQADEADIVSEAMRALHEKALKTDRPWLAPLLPIHDDLEFIVPRRHLDEAIHEIVPIMCARPFKWMSVPMLIEGAVGTNWYNVKKNKIGKFKSHTFEKQLRTFKCPEI